MTDATSELRTLNEAYADAVFRRDAADWGALWTADARWDLAGHAVAGRDAIVATWVAAMAQFSFVAFFAQLGPVTLDGDRASMRVYTHELLETPDGAQRRTVGQYDDLCARDAAGVWRFASRRFELLRG